MWCPNMTHVKGVIFLCKHGDDNVDDIDVSFAVNNGKKAIKIRRDSVIHQYKPLI